MKKIILGIFITYFSLNAEIVTLKEGWNLIGIPSTLSASSLSTNPNILSVTGGGVGGGASFTYNKEYSQYASGNFILGQGYWVKVDTDTTLEYTKVSTPSSIMLKEGWNLINPFNTLEASKLVEYPQILSVTGGGVGGGASFTYNKEYSQYASGETIDGQGYWVKVSEDMELVFAIYDYIAWGIGGDSTTGKTTIRINGIDYTVIVYSTLDIDQNSASQSGEYTLLVGSALGKSVNQLKINGDYTNENIKLKFFSSSSIFDETTLVAESETLLANGSLVEYGNLEFSNENDYSVPNPENLSADLNPPVSPIF